MRLRAIFMSALFVHFLPAQAEVNSIYTAVDPKSCILVDSSALHPDRGGDFMERECPSFGGYQVIISGGDLRYNLKLRYADHFFELRVPPSFHDLGSSSIEWRYEVTEAPLGRTIRYRALIYRMSYHNLERDDPGKPGTLSELVVVGLRGGKTCVLGIVGQGREMNARARSISDDLARPCLKN